MKKGFTIIELIAVVTIIAVLIAVAFLMLSGSINSAKVKAYNQNIDKVIETTELYIANGNLDSPLAVGDTAEVTVEELITAGYLKAIKSPFDKSKTCNGYVLIEKTTDDEYLYNPYLNCAADIGNSTEDGLVLHYTFDDFQEPTMNYLAYASSLSASNWSSYGFGDSYVNTQITTSSDGYLNSNSIKVNRLTTHTYMTAATSYKSSAIVLLPGEKITASAYIRAGSSGVVGKTLQIHIYGLKTGGGNFSLGVDTAPLTSDWVRYEYTLTNTDAVNWTVANIYFRLNCGTSLLAGEHYYISSPQIEKKGYSTPFVDGSRTGVVKDYSGNNNDGESNGLVPTANSLNQSNKAVEFNGISDYIEIPNYSISNNSTISVWLKATLADGYQIIVGDYNSIALGLFGSYFIGSTVTSRPLGIINNCFINNEWNHIAVVIENYEVKYYCNNILLLNTGGNAWSWDDSAFAYIGRRNPATAGGIYYFKGKMSDFRIYERPLSALEIKEIYMLEN